MDKHILSVLANVGKNSNDNKRKVASVIYNDKNIICAGFNTVIYNKLVDKNQTAQHAEMSVIRLAEKNNLNGKILKVKYGTFSVGDISQRGKARVPPVHDSQNKQIKRGLFSGLPGRSRRSTAETDVR